MNWIRVNNLFIIIKHADKIKNIHIYILDASIAFYYISWLM